MAIVRWDPYREMTSMQERLSRLFDEANRGDDDVMQRGEWLPAVDIYQTDAHEIVLTAEIPGVRKEDLDLRVEQNTLTLSGSRSEDREVKKERTHRVERSYGSFFRSFSLPSTIDAEKVRAEYKDGVLTVTLPLREELKPKQIPVTVAS